MGDKTTSRDVRFIYTGRIAELGAIILVRGVKIGAGVTHKQAMEGLPNVPAALYEVWRRFGSAQVRATGTVCGNVAMDRQSMFHLVLLPWALASSSGMRKVPIGQFFYPMAFKTGAIMNLSARYSCLIYLQMRIFMPIRYPSDLTKISQRCC